MQPDDVDVESPTWSELRSLFGAYVNQDFDIHGSPWDAVTAYAGDSNDGSRSVAARSLRQLLTSLDETSLKRVVDRFGMATYPPGDGYSSYRVWLTAVAEFLEDPATHPGPPERDAPLPDTEGAGSRRSTFTDHGVAERAVAQNLRAHRRDIDAWLADPSLGTNRAFEHHHDAVIGRLAPVDATPETIHDVDRSRIILRRSNTTPEGWFLRLARPVATDPTSPIARAIDRTSPEWDPLWTLCAGYLHQDFGGYGHVARAVTEFETENPDRRAGAAAGIRRLLEHDDEPYLAAATEWLGMDYSPLRDGHTHRTWLTTLAERLERPGDSAER